jgi:hypothetical protein
MTLHRTVFAAVLFIALGSGWAAAQTQVRFVEYSAKFLCGLVEEQAPLSPAPVRPGIYDTSINIHNPQFLAKPIPSVIFLKKAVLSLPEGEKPVPPSGFRRDILQADFAERVDCRTIREILGPAGTGQFIEGYVVLILLAPNELDVTGVYTATGLPQQPPTMALEMMTIAPRIVVPSPAAAREMQDQMKEPPKPGGM